MDKIALHLFSDAGKFMSHLFFAASRAQSSSQVELHTRNCSSPKTAVPFITFSPTSPSLSHLTDIDYVISCLTSFMDDSIIERERGTPGPTPCLLTQQL